MDAAELLSLAAWFEREIKSRQIPRLYTKLAAAVQQLAGPGQPKQPLAPHREALEGALLAVDLDALTIGQRKLLDALQVRSLLGKEGADEVRRALTDSGIDLIAAHAVINSYAGRIAKAVERVAQIHAAVDGLVSSSVGTPDGKVAIEVHFKDGASIGNVVDLKKWSEQINTIARGFSAAHKVAPEEFEVRGAGTGSVVVYFAATMVVARSLTSALLRILEVVQRVQDIRLKAEEIRALKLKNDAAEQALEIAAKELEGQGAEQIKDDVVHEFGLQLDGEQEEALKRAVSALTRFVRSGGELSVSPPEISEGDSDRNLVALNEQASRVRKLQSDVRRLGYQPDAKFDEEAGGK